MNNDLPEFRNVHNSHANTYAQKVFGDALKDVRSLGNGAFRALFGQNYFTIQPGNDAPSKSQWSTLKKRMKRINKGVFIFRKHGELEQGDVTFYYMDFGFMQD